jgi:regulator of replication initiation timing
MHKRLSKFLFVLLFTLLGVLNSSYSNAQEHLILSEAAPQYILAEKYFRIYKDPTQQLDHKAVLQKQFTLKKVDAGDPDFETSNYWIRFTIENRSSSWPWVLEMLDFGIRHVAFYDILLDTLIETGYAHPFGQRAYYHKNFVFNLLLPAGTTKTYLIKVSSTSGFQPMIKIRSNERFVAYANTEYVLLGFYYGILALIACYNFFVFLSIRDKAHLFYVFYVLSVGLKSLQWDGLGFQYLWPGYPVVNEWLDFAPQLLLVSFAAYSSYFLELRKKHLVYYKTMLLSLAFYFLCYAIDRWLLPLSYIQLIYLIPFVVLYSISILLYRKGFQHVRFFVQGYSLLILSQLIYFLISKGIRLENELVILMFVYSLNIGFVIETFIFSIALADKIKIFKHEKEKAQQLIIDQLRVNEELKQQVNRELEQKVSERTQELEEAKIKLQEQAEAINNMNRLLDLENYKLKSNVKDINIERGLLKALSLEEFVQTFPDESACYRFLEELKWKDGFVCHKCQGQKYVKGSDPFARRCTQCHYIETIKANTIFHNIKFPIEKAFQMVYLTLTSEKEISTYELARLLQLQQKTCWSFRQKITDEINRKQISKKDLMQQGWVILIK